MKLMVTGDVCIEEIEAESFEIEGSNHKFAVHECIRQDKRLRGAYGATHVESGFLIGWGDTPEAAIEMGKSRWQSKTPAELEFFIKRAMDFRGAQMILYKSAKTEGIAP